LNKKIGLFVFWVVFLGLIYLMNRTPEKIRLEFDLALHHSKSENPIGQFYYDTGNGFNEKESKILQYIEDTKGRFYHYSIVFPVQDINRLRFDPLPGAGLVRMKNIIIRKNYPIKIVFEDIEHSLVPMNAIESVRGADNIITIVTNGPDPFFQIVEDPFVISFSDVTAFFRYVSVSIDKMVAGILSLLLLSILLTQLVFSND